MQQYSSFSGPAYLFAAGRNGWLAGYGLYSYVDDDHIQQTTETPVLVAQNAATGEKKVLDFTYEDRSVTRLTLADHSPLMAAETEDCQILLYDLETGSGQILSESYAFGEIDALFFSDGDDLLFIYTSTSRLDGYDLETGEMVCSIEKPFSDVTSVSGIRRASAVTLSDHRLLISGWQSYGPGWAAVLDTDAMVLAARIKNYYDYSASTGQALIKTGQTLSRCPIHSLETLMEQAAALVR